MRRGRGEGREARVQDGRDGKTNGGDQEPQSGGGAVRSEETAK